MQRWSVRFCTVFFLALPGASAHGVELPRIFSDGMVLQRDQPIPVWGRCDGCERVVVTFAGTAAEDLMLKVYLDASPEVRAARRHREVTELDYETVAADLARRDALDQGRDDSPLRTADDAVVIDTSDLTVDEIVSRVVEAMG